MITNCYDQFVAEQEVLRKLTKKESLPAGMALVGNAFCEPKHKDTRCKCEKGFTVIKCSLDLSRWRNQEIDGVQVKALSLMRHGYVSRMILTQPEQANLFNDYWQFNHLVHKFFKVLGPDSDGFLNLEFNSIPPCYGERYPHEARHHIEMTLLRHHRPYQTILTTGEMENLIVPGEIRAQLRLWRACASSTD